MSNKSVEIIESWGLVRQRINLLAVKEFRSLGVSLRQSMILRYLDKHESPSPTDLSSNMESHLAAISRALRTLEKKGWIIKIQHQGDNRKWILKLTEKGQEKTAEIERVIEAVSSRLVNSLEEPEQDNFHFLLKKIVNSLEQQKR